MGWADLLGESETIIAPWLGGRRIVSGVRQWAIDGQLPPEHGWYSFTVKGNRKAEVVEPAMADPELFAKSDRVLGYIIGNRLMADDADLELSSGRIIERTRVVYLLEPGLERFARVMTAVHDGRLVYLQQEFPLGPEPDVAMAFEDRKRTVDDIPEVTPALHMVFRWYTWWRNEEERLAREEEERIRREEEAERRRIEEERRQAEQARVRAEEERRARERRRAEDRYRQRQAAAAERAVRRLPRRQREGARSRYQAESVLLAAGAELLDWTPSGGNQATVRFRFLGHRFRSVVRVPSLRVVEAGICLTDGRTGERGDDRFTLASLPGVIQQAQRLGQLVILRW